MDLVFSNNRPEQIIGDYLTFYESISSKTMFNNYRTPKMTKKKVIDFIDLYGHYEFLKSNSDKIYVYIYTIQELELLYNNKNYQKCIKNITIDIYMNQIININEYSFDNLKVFNLLNYNKPLENNLDYLSNLEELNINYYTFPLNKSLYKLEKLKKLSILSYTHEFKDSLSKLKNLEELIIYEYNHPFKNSLDQLVNLKIIESWRFNKPIHNSFDKLVNLRSLKLNNYNIFFNNSLSKLVNLEELKVHSYKEKLDTSLNNLKKLHTLKLDLITSLDNVNPDIILNIKNLSVTIPLSKKYIIYNFINLTELTVKKYNSLDLLKINIKHFKSLEILNII
jgi:hypothetical protein